MSASRNRPSLISTALSVPTDRHSRSTDSAAGGPMLIAHISAPQRSFTRTAASSAYMSFGFIIAGTPSRMRLPVSGSIFTRSTSGTCFTHNNILSIPAPPQRQTLPGFRIPFGSKTCFIASMSS